MAVELKLAEADSIIAMITRNNIALLHYDELVRYDYGGSHPMKTHRSAMTFDLLNGYDLLYDFKIYVS